MDMYLVERCPDLEFFEVGDKEAYPVIEKWLNNKYYNGYDLVNWLPTSGPVLQPDAVFKRRN